ncbi:hypothetical protein KJ765_03670 [Candidatus Micrarchaeota archaeon]|nr:hypothetical protein [Candidatus Micrarchaeota archaeon]
MRTLLGILSREGFVRMTKAGCRLTPKGSSYWYRMMKKLRWMGDAPKSPLTFHLPAYGLMVSGAASVVKRGLEERDAAIREGALGATVLVVEKNRLFFPGTRESSGDPLAKSLLDSISAQNGDALVLSYGPSRVLSERGAWAAALNWLN